MIKKVELSLEERQVLKKLNNEQLRLLANFKDMAEFQVIVDLANIMIDIDKNYFFRENEATMEPITLALKHAYLRGASARGVVINRLIASASSEILRREEVARKMKVESAKNVQGGK
jgi:hypothetical protein